MRRTLVVMVKVPRPGRVKTRLARDIGRIEAAWWMRHHLRALVARLRDPRWLLVLAVAPDREGQLSRALPARLPRWPQGRGDLGARMRRQMRRAAPGPVCVIGADIPRPTRADIALAFAALGPADLVFGPAPDGGYWLVGAARPRHLPAGFLQHVRWSGPHALADSRASVPDARIAIAAMRADVDTATDLADCPPPWASWAVLP